MEKVITVGLDITKQVFQVHGIDASGAVVVRQKLRRDDVSGFFEALPSCRIGIEACATGHHRARFLTGLGHDVRLMLASFVKPYVKQQKNDEPPPGDDPGNWPDHSQPDRRNRDRRAALQIGRQLAAWLGLVPRQNFSGGKDRLDRISKQGDPYIRGLLVVGAHAVLRFSRTGKAVPTRWAAELLTKKPYNVVAVAPVECANVESRMYERQGP